MLVLVNFEILNVPVALPSRIVILAAALDIPRHAAGCVLMAVCSEYGNLVYLNKIGAQVFNSPTDESTKRGPSMSQRLHDG